MPTRRTSASQANSEGSSSRRFWRRRRSCSVRPHLEGMGTGVGESVRIIGGRPAASIFRVRIAEISPEGAGSGHRNHCPHCLHSLHVDVEPGDRASDCRGDMEPIAIWVKDGGEWAIVHRCKKCGKLSTNRVLADDDPLQLMSLAVRALANPPFPLRMLRDCLKREG